MRWSIGLILSVAVAVVVAAGDLGPARAKTPSTSGMARIAGGEFVPLYGVRDKPTRVAPFLLDTHPVTNAAFLGFVTEHTRWRRGEVPPIFAGDDYLEHWSGPTEPGPRAPAESPVTGVSWFAAKAYCRAVGKRLPTMAEWEFAARADETRKDAADHPGFAQRILSWYGKPTRLPLPAVGSTYRSAWGVYDMHGLVWEWVSDFNAVLATGESRKDGSLDRNLFCAAGSIGAVDPKDYAAFLRYAMRGSLQARYAVRNLGFRCAKEIP